MCRQLRFGGMAKGLLLFAALCPFGLHAQTIHFDDGTPLRSARVQHVTFDAEPVVVPAGQPAWMELHFHIAPGYHINSHTPTDELLVPTTLKLNPMPALRLLGDVYPAGTPLQLHIGGGETLSAYTGDVLIRLHVLAQKGDTVLTGMLRYQACDAGSCFPPRDLPVSLPLSVR